MNEKKFNKTIHDFMKKTNNLNKVLMDIEEMLYDFLENEPIVIDSYLATECDIKLNALKFDIDVYVNRRDLMSFTALSTFFKRIEEIFSKLFKGLEVTLSDISIKKDEDSDDIDYCINFVVYVSLFDM